LSFCVLKNAVLLRHLDAKWKKKGGKAMARVLKSVDGKDILVMDSGFAASRKDGKWVSGSLYDHFEISEFRTVRDKAEADALLKEAHGAIKHLATA
jgi:hypothetical protein